MDIQILILDYILSERIGILLLLVAVLYYMYIQNKIQSNMERELKGVKDITDHTDNENAYYK